MSLRSILSGAVLAAMACLPVSAQASTLVGKTIVGSYFFPDLTQPLTSSPVFALNPFVVGSGVDSVLTFSDLFDLTIDFSAHQLVLTMPSNVGTMSFFSATFNGPTFQLDPLEPFDSLTSVAGIDPLRVALSADHFVLGINLQGLSFGAGEQIIVNFADVNPVPLPAALPLFASGLGVLGFLNWRRRRWTAEAAA